MSYDGTAHPLLGDYNIYLSAEKAENIAPHVITDMYAQRLDIPPNKGDTIRLIRHLRYDKKATALTEGLGQSSPTLIHKTSYIEGTLAAYGDYIEMSTDLEAASIIAKAEDVKNAQNDQIVDTMDWLNMVAICTGLEGYRIDDAAGDYQTSGTCTSAGSTTTAVCSTLTQADDFWNGGFIAFNAQTSRFGLVRQVSDFANSSGTVTWVTALPEATSTSDTFWICVGTGIDSSAKITMAGLLKTKRQIILNKMAPFQLMSKGKNRAQIYIAMTSPYVTYDMWLDNDIKDKCLHQGDGEYETGAFARFLGLDFVEMSDSAAYRESVSGSQSATGVVHVVPIIGKNCYATTRINGHGKSPDGIVMEVKPDPAPQTRFHSLAWTAYRLCLVKCGLSGIRLMLGATS